MFHICVVLVSSNYPVQLNVSVEVEQLALTGFTEVLVKEEPTKTVSFPVHTSDPQAITTVINNEEVVQVSSHLVLGNGNLVKSLNVGVV